MLERRLAGTRCMLEAWEAAGRDPVERIRSFIDMLTANRAEIQRHGCPVGTLCSELAKLEHAARNDANGLFALFRDWLGRQFAALGFEREADGLAMHLLAMSQGVATLANAFDDESFMRREVTAMHAWLDAQIARRPAG